MSKLSRRGFLASTTAAAGAAALAGRFGWAGEGKAKITSGTDVVTLGRSGVKTSLVGIGTGTSRGRQHRALGQKNFTRLVRHGYDHGVRYIDTADLYGTHDLVRGAMARLPREEVFLLTKIWAHDAKTAEADVDRLRRELGVEYVDTMLMHCMMRKGWPTDMRPVMDVLHEAKEKGRVRAVGVSCHGFDPLVSSADCDWCDVHLVRINPYEMMMDGPPDDVSAQIKKMHELKHGVLGMKVFGHTGLKSPDERLESLKYVLGLGAVHAFTIGFTSPEQIDETMSLIEKAVM